ncbi:MAG: hypothetical protein U0235_23820 [Polyangiaceae bacterium]
MKKHRLVLVKWHDDVVAAHTVETGEPVDVPGLPPAGTSGAAGEDGVQYEVFDVAPEPALRRGLRPDLRATLGLMASVSAHIAVGMAIITAAWLTADSASADDAAETRASMLRNATLKVAAGDEGEKAKEQSKEEAAAAEQAARDKAEREKGRHSAEPWVPDEPILPEVARGPQEPPPAQTKKEAENALEEGTTVAQPPKAENAPRSPTARPQAPTLPGPRTDGRDAVTASAATCTHVAVPAAHGAMCTKTVVVDSFAKRPGCFVDTVFTDGQRGKLTMPCDGDGPATLSFGAKSFSGAVIGGKVDVCTGTEYPFADGCTWLSAQRVSGSVASGSFKFAYGEAPRAGQHDCASACTATAMVRVAD